MGQVRRVGWAVALATVAIVGASAAAKADIASDKMAAIVIYPKVEVDTSAGEDTVIRLANTNKTQPILAHCFYVDANSHCNGGANDGDLCETGADCAGGTCEEEWLETDFRIQLTFEQPIQWIASEGLADSRVCDGGANDGDACRTSEDCAGERCVGLPLAQGSCSGNPFFSCSSNSDCAQFGAGTCTQSNVGTRIPPVPEDPFRGELRCIAIDTNGVPVPRNELIGQGIFTRADGAAIDQASYNAIGIQGTGASSGAANELVIGGANPEYNGCPNYLIVNHFAEDAINPVPDTDQTIESSLILVPCSNDYLRQKPGSAVLQFLVFNEFEQRLSTSTSFKCYHEERLCETTPGQCERSIWNVSVLGTLSAQTRIQALPTGSNSSIPSAVLGLLQETYVDNNITDETTAIVNLHQQGARSTADLITIP